MVLVWWFWFEIIWICDLDRRIKHAFSRSFGAKSSMCKFWQQCVHPEVFAPINGWPLNTFLVLSGFTWARNVTLFVSIVELYGSLFEYCLLVGAFYPASSCIWCGSKWYWLQQCVEDVPRTHYKDRGVVSRYLCDVQSLISILQRLGWWRREGSLQHQETLTQICTKERNSYTFLQQANRPKIGVYMS